jgi:predicted outer membrane repeat protein
MTNGGGAVYTIGNLVSIGNNGSTADIIGNTANFGGAIRSVGTTTINGNVTLSGNMAGTNGGAVYAGKGFTLNAGGPTTITGKGPGRKAGPFISTPVPSNLNATGGDITFSDNTENTTGTGRVNAIYFNSGNANFNAAAGNITFLDPIESNPARHSDQDRPRDGQLRRHELPEQPSQPNLTSTQTQ